MDIQKEEINKAKMQEYSEILGVIREMSEEQDISEICLNNNTLRTLAGYTKDSNSGNFNMYIKQYMDKLIYDKHNEKVRIAQEQGDEVTIRRLSNEIMDMAGYARNRVYAMSNIVNQYAKSFVDRIFMEKEMSSLYDAINRNCKEDIDDAYRRIYEKSSYSSNRPYNVVNQYAQAFVEEKKKAFIRKGIHKQAG